MISFVFVTVELFGRVVQKINQMYIEYKNLLHASQKTLHLHRSTTREKYQTTTRRVTAETH